jgi:SAM-dependent methyltransferase
MSRFGGKIWGMAEASLRPTSLSALRLKYCLEDLTKIKGRVLEMGCGAGMFALAIKKYRPDLEIYGCDLDQESILAARKRSQEIKFLIGDAHRLPFKKNSFAAVVSFDVLEHLKKPAKAIAEVSRILKPEGIFHFYVPLEGDFYTVAGFFKKFGLIPKKDYAGHAQQLTLQELRQILTKAGFRIEKERFSPHLFYQLVDFGYFLFLSILKRRVETTVEGYLERNEKSRGFNWRLISFFKNTISLISFWESSIFSQIPAQGVHSSCVKADKISLAAKANHPTGRLKGRFLFNGKAD